MVFGGVSHTESQNISIMSVCSVATAAPAADHVSKRAEELLEI